MEHKTFAAAVKGFKGFRDDENMILDQIISTEQRDDGGDVMLQDGMIERGEVVVLYQHGMDPVIGTRPIGKPLGFRKEIVNGVKCTIARMQYYDGSNLPNPDNLGRLLYDMDSKGFLPNNSIGFNALEETPDRDGRVVSKWSLHEFSKVNVGMNSGCITVHSIGGKVEFKYIDTKDAKPDPAKQQAAPSGLAARFEKLMVESGIPKCDPGDYSTESEFMHACVSEMVDGGHAQDQAVAACINIWNEKSLRGKSSLQKRFDELMRSTEKSVKSLHSKENKGMDNLAKSAEQIAHKACHVLHAALINDLKAEAEASGDASVESEKIAKKCFKEYGEMALPHVAKYIEAVKAKEKPDDEPEDDDDSDEKNLKEAGHKIHHKAMKMAHKAMIEEIHSYAGKKDTDHEKEAARLIGEHEKVARPHAKEFVEKWADHKAKKTFGGIDTKSIADNIAHQSAQTNMRMIHEGMVSECYSRAWDDKASDPETIADQVSKEACDLHKPHLKAICEKVRADSPKDIGEYQKKHYSTAATNPAGTATPSNAIPDSQPVDSFVQEFAAEQKTAAKPEFSLSDVAAEIKSCLPDLINTAVTKEIRKAQGRID